MSGSPLMPTNAATDAAACQRGEFTRWARSSAERAATSSAPRSRRRAAWCTRISAFLECALAMPLRIYRRPARAARGLADGRGPWYKSRPCGSNSVGRVSASQAECRGFESRLPLSLIFRGWMDSAAARSEQDEQRPGRIRDRIGGAAGAAVLGPGLRRRSCPSRSPRRCRRSMTC